MPRPQDVNPRNFKVLSVLYDDGSFSVARGVWEDGVERLGMRWNGEGEDSGYPKTFGKPVWFVLPTSLSDPIARALMGLPGSAATTAP
jgi:hypothetical protein